MLKRNSVALCTSVRHPGIQHYCCLPQIIILHLFLFVQVFLQAVAHCTVYQKVVPGTTDSARLEKTGTAIGKGPTLYSVQPICTLSIRPFDRGRSYRRGFKEEPCCKSFAPNCTITTLEIVCIVIRRTDLLDLALGSTAVRSTSCLLSLDYLALHD